MPVTIPTVKHLVPYEVDQAFNALQAHANQLEAQVQRLQAQLASQTPILTVAQVKQIIATTPPAVIVTQTP